MLKKSTYCDVLSGNALHKINKFKYKYLNYYKIIKSQNKVEYLNKYFKPKHQPKVPKLNKLKL